eukprot:1913606-Rhodomonas_salina.1
MADSLGTKTHQLLDLPCSVIGQLWPAGKSGTTNRGWTAGMSDAAPRTHRPCKQSDACQLHLLSARCSAEKVKQFLLLPGEGTESGGDRREEYA